MYNMYPYATSTDRYSVQGAEEYRINDLCQQLKLPLEDILRAVQEVGFDPDEVEEYIRDRENRSLF